MDSTAVYAAIRSVVLAYMPDSRIVLFGSRARGDHDQYSDYDLLIITPSTMSQQEKIRWSTRIDRTIVSEVHVPVDVLMNSEEEVLEKQELPGHIIRSAVREGITL